MKYLTGILAFGVPCERDSCGKWNLRKEDFLNDELMKLKESDESPFKDYGIEENKLVPYREFCVYNVADHVRAYCDMLYECKFDELKGLFYECISDIKSRNDIFMLVYGKLRDVAWFDGINMFMINEFGNIWESYLDSVKGVSEHVGKMAQRYEDLMASVNG